MKQIMECISVFGFSICEEFFSSFISILVKADLFSSDKKLVLSFNLSAISFGHFGGSNSIEKRNSIILGFSNKERRKEVTNYFSATS